MSGTPNLHKDTAIPLSRILDEYADWFIQAIRHGFYGQPDHAPPAVTDSFNGWIKDAQKKKDIEPAILAQIQLTHDGLMQAASRVLSAQGTLPAATDFDSFTQHYDGFTAQIRRLEWDSLLADSGVDYLTGLRSESALMIDLEKELERRARRGQPFCIVMCRIDEYAQITAQGPAARDVVMKQAGAALLKCIRGFDDAYRFGQAEFVASLKHSDGDGGLKFVTRLRAILKDMNVPFTMSYCVAEPTPGDSVTELLGNVKADLDKISASGAAESGRYEEISALQRFVKNLKE